MPRGRMPGRRAVGAGWFGSANGGTLYLDEIGDLPLPIQIKLLAALENHETTRVGAQQPSPVDVRHLVSCDQYRSGPGGQRRQVP